MNSVSIASRARRPLGALLFILGFAALSAPAWAQGGEESGEGEQHAAEETAQPAGPTPRLFMLPTDSVAGEITSIIPERVDDDTRARLKEQRGLELLPGYRQIQERLGGGRNASAAVAEAERLYTSGIGSLAAGDSQRAAETFQRALDMMNEHLSDLQNFDVYADTLANLSLAYFQSNFDLDARKLMQRYAQLRPGATLDPEKFPADLREVFTSELDRVEKAGPGVLAVVGNVDGAEVYLDGELKGVTPARIDGVGFGHHYLVVRGGGSVWAQEVRVRGRGTEQAVSVELGAPREAQASADEDLPAFYLDLRETLRSGRFGAELSPYLVELTTRTGADFVAWVIMVRDGRDYAAAPFVYRARDGMVVQGENVSFNMEMSNQRVGVSRLATEIATAVRTMPADRAVVDVDLAPAPAVAVEVPVESGEAGTDTGSTSGVREVSEEEVARAPLPTPGPAVEDPEVIAAPAAMPSEGRSNTKRYLAYGGAAVLAGGAIAGTLFLILRSSASQPAAFEAEVEW
ncbi:PEGA domain-containing protein [Lujinxingia vulgaris]|uniref:PEGA domain-containing protein n=1 Tax=Lujinxingia vulgaris TaxID=2600176 RepID=A0A5C6X6M3_9DELT|nr:PEGA domain-containing protein [Lujinxingia vulgaris]TXD37524.1 PEGA domain-containing protein [Lujinxingia vulgaris]